MPPMLWKTVKKFLFLIYASSNIWLQGMRRSNAMGFGLMEAQTCDYEQILLHHYHFYSCDQAEFTFPKETSISLFTPLCELPWK